MPNTLFDPETEKRIDSWLQGDYDAETKEEIRRLRKEKPEALVDAFYTTLAFGTGGLRGIVGVGTNRMNKYTIRGATQGLANYIRKTVAEKTPSVFISYDSRVTSRPFTEEAARVLAANGIRTYITHNLRPTPLASFGCRHFKCCAAIMITASHNPPEYNGYKVYWSDGGQVVPPHDKGIIQEVQAIADISKVPVASFPNPLITEVGEELDNAYLEAIAPLQFQPELDKQNGSKLKIVYTPLHGTGATMVPKTLKKWGFSNVSVVTAQNDENGRFPTVRYPNPEEPTALKLGIEQMVKEGADLLLANDPDADRIGLALMHQGKPVILTGNQIASLCASFILETLSEQKRLPSNGALIKSIVTTELLRAIAEAYKKPCFDVLPGFKYIAALILTWEKDSSHQFIFGGEESLGYLVGTHSRDKDGVVCCALLAEVALKAKLEGKTLLDKLDQLYTTYGVYREELKSINFPETRAGRDQMSKVMGRLRGDSLKEIGGSKVVKVDDFLKLKPASDILIFHLEDHSRLVVRPSGTEPKVKLYCGVHKIPEKDLDETVKQCDAHCDALLTEMAGLLS
jgi:phosphomannomutase